MINSVVAVFDLDDTITQSQTLLPLLRQLSFTRLAKGLTRSSPRLALSLWQRDQRDIAKEHLLQSVMRGQATSDMRDLAEQFASSLAQHGLNEAVIERIGWHQSSGHRVVIASATPEFVVRPIASRLSVDDVVATRLAVEDGRYTGRYEGRNVRGAEKLRRVEELLGGAPQFAYGNLPDDELLLRSAEESYVIRRGQIKPYEEKFS